MGWEDAGGVLCVLNLRCWKDSRAELPRKALEMQTEVQETVRRSPCLTQREGERGLELKVAFM